MKKTIFGSTIFIAGVIACALMLAGAIVPDWTLNGQIASAWWVLSQKGLMPAFFLFLALGVIGLVIAVVGIFEKEKADETEV